MIFYLLIYVHYCYLRQEAHVFCLSSSSVSWITQKIVDEFLCSFLKGYAFGQEIVG